VGIEGVHKYPCPEEAERLIAGAVNPAMKTYKEHMALVRAAMLAVEGADQNGDEEFWKVVYDHLTLPINRELDERIGGMQIRPIHIEGEYTIPPFAGWEIV